MLQNSIKEHLFLINELNDLIDYAWEQALKHRFDPILGKVHASYLNELKKLRSTQNEKLRNQSENKICKLSKLQK